MRHHVRRVFGGGGSIQLFRVLGIRVGASPSWFVVLFLLIYLLSDYFDDYWVAVGAAFCFFASLLLHELGHALVARREGIGISGIDLWFFGGLARMTREPDTPGEEFRVAVAGPLATALVIGLCVLIGTLLSQTGDVLDAALLESPDVGAGVQLVGWLALVNAFLLAFNLVPAFPLDGGRIARAAVWRATGDRNRATRASARLGQGFGYLLIGVGIALIAAGDPANGIYMAVLGLFLGQAARGAILSSAFSERLEGITAADVMDDDPVAVPGDADARRTHDEFFLRYGWPSFPVTDAAGRYLGLLRAERVDEALAGGLERSAAADLADADHDLRVAAATPLQALLAHEPLARLGTLSVVDAQERLVGTLTVQQVRRALAASASEPLRG
ncbi:site-2 protease family protein [Conexibacter sp. SYSU D00693]|uniref:site-2 protease family protein n=1 Tax=Conexibacter sp. SYSU D00693 TaxID=2812560 RepID=UPI00196B2E38|nr:site-2 protease family protein [Conexibacter sp. SYSU D00693]